MSFKIQLRRGTAATWTSINPILAQGEYGFETDTLKTKIGDGTTAWNSLAYSSTVNFSGSLAGDVTGGQSSTVVGKINGQSLAALTTGILKNTTTTGVPSIAIAADFPTLNQNTSGTAANITATSNSTLITLSGLSLPGSQVSSAVSNATTAVSFSGSLAGDVTGTQGATTVGKINGQSMATLATGILKNTTTTGVPSIAVAGDFPTLNQNTTGTAANITGTSNSTITTLSSLSLPGSQVNSIVASATQSTNATNVATTATNTTNATFYPSFVGSATSGNQGIDTATGLTFNPSTNTLTTTTFAGALTGNASGTAASFTGNLTGDVTSTGMSTIVGKINGTSLAALATGILKNTTTTGVPSIAIAGDFPTLNQNTTGTSASFTGNLTGDVTSTGMATTVGKINGTSLATLATGILKNTTTTGVPSIAVAGDFPTLNQNTTGTAASVTGTNVVTNSNLSQMATLTLKGNNTGIIANAADLTVAQVNAILPIFTATLNGLAPLSGGGTTNFLRADGSWSAPPSGFTNPMTTLGDIIYENATPTPARLAGNITAGKMMLSQTGNGTISAAPVWAALVSGDIPANAANTSGTAANITATSNSTLTTLSSLSLPGSQVSSIVASATLATNATNVATTATNTTNATFYPTFVGAATSGNQGIDTATGLSFNPSTNTLTTTTVAANLTGNASGTAANITGTTNSTITTLSALSLPGTQVTGTVPAATNATNVTGTNVVANSNLAQMATLTLKGNNTGGTANAADLTVAQVNAILPVFTSTLNGSTPLSGGGTTNFLRADGTWQAPPGGGGMTNPMTSVGDMIVGTTAGAPSRLAIGTNAYVLTSNGSTASWAPAPGAGGGTTVNTGTAQVNFGTGKDDNYASVAVSNVNVTANSLIQCQIDCTASTTNHDPDDAVVEGLLCYPQARVAGVGFTIAVAAPFGTFGTYNLNYQIIG